jgi:hypothetical protein
MRAETLTRHPFQPIVDDIVPLNVIIRGRGSSVEAERSSAKKSRGSVTSLRFGNILFRTSIDPKEPLFHTRFV